jgi:ribosome recycling factor
MNDPDEILLDVQERMLKAVDHLKDELRGLRTGRASPALVDNIKVDYYGSPTPMGQIAQISIPEARQIAIKPFDKNALKPIETALLTSDLGLQPSSDGKLVRVTLPPLSEEQRKKLAGRAKEIAEEAKVSIRNVRRDGNKNAETAMKDKSNHISEDQGKDLLDSIQQELKDHEKQVEDILKAKTQEIMTV